jgi:hypothetical protein
MKSGTALFGSREDTKMLGKSLGAVLPAPGLDQKQDQNHYRSYERSNINLAINLHLDTVFRHSRSPGRGAPQTF